MKEVCIFKKFSYLGDDMIKSLSDLDNTKSNANECELKVMTIKINSHELTTDKGICKYAWNRIGKKGKYLDVGENYTIEGECKVSDCQPLHQKVISKLGSGRCSWFFWIMAMAHSKLY